MMSHYIAQLYKLAEYTSIGTGSHIITGLVMKWLLHFNITETFIMHLSSTIPCHMYHMDGQPLQVVSEHKDLGIIVDPCLIFHSQATAATRSFRNIVKKSLCDRACENRACGHKLHLFT